MSFTSCLAVSQSGEEDPPGRVFAILSVSSLLPCAIAVPILPAPRCVRMICQEHWALVLTTGASLPSWVRCSSPFLCMQCLVAVLLP